MNMSVVGGQPKKNIQIPVRKQQNTSNAQIAHWDI